MYTCENCGYEFPEDCAAISTETHGFDNPPYEHRECCPRCGADDLSDGVVHCAECGIELSDDDSFAGYCIDCLRKLVTYENARSFLTDGNGCLMGNFMLWLLNEDYTPSEFHPLFIWYLTREFNRLVEQDIAAESPELLEKIRVWLIDEDVYTADDFAHFCTERNMFDEK